MHSPSKILGMPPCVRGLFSWFLAGMFSVGAWYFSLFAPMPGLVAVGVTPFVNLYLFFRGFNQMRRTIPYVKTLRTAQRLHLRPTWGCHEGGFLLVDESRELWVADGIAGSFGELSGLRRQSDGHAFRLELFTEKSDTPFVRVGMGSSEQLRAVAEKMSHCVSRATGRDVQDVPETQD